jgi:1,2-diacylglycerol 3-beta-glucosyltransferase
LVRVLIADEKEDVRAAVRALLADQAGYSAAGEAVDGPGALALARSLRPDLIVLDNALPGLSGIDIAQTVAAELPDTAIIFLAADPAVREAALAAGATAFVPKDAPSDELLRAIHASVAAHKLRRGLREISPAWRRVFELLLGSRLLTEEQLQSLLLQQNPHESPATSILRQGLVGQQDLADALARASGSAVASLAPYPELVAPIDPTETRLSAPRLVDPVERSAARLLPFDFARSRGVLVTASDGHNGVLAMVDPLDESALHEVGRFTGLKLVRVTATLDDVQNAVLRAWSSNGTGPVIWTGGLLSRIYASAVLLVIGLSAVGGFGLVVHEALAPRFAFSLFALFCGLFFFLYALKYYVTIASVVLVTLFGDPQRFGRNSQPAAPAPNETRGSRKADGRVRNDALGSGEHKEGYRTLRGDLLSQAGAVVVTDPWQRIGELRLPADRQPFVSVQLAMYNESEVVDRLLTACTSFDYENYEVLVVDDSTDDTVQKLEKWAKHPRVRVLHRSTRKGFKGGALQEALKRMNPRTEYVMIFDADFVPPADAIWHFLDYFGQLAKTKYGSSEHAPSNGAPQNGDRVAAVQGYQWHMLNASENWITKGVRAEFSGSYVLERAGQELFGAMKMISGSVYMIRADVLRKLGWSTSITEDWELTIRLYLAGYKVLYTPYIQAPAECVSTIRRLIKQRMRWAEGHTYNVRKYFWPILRSPNLTWQEKLEFIYYAPYYLQSVLFSVATGSWIIGVLILGQKLPMWGEVFGWSLVVSNALALPLMNLAGVLLEGSLRRDALGLLSFIGLSWILAPFQAYASMKAMSEKKEGGWVRTPKSGVVTERLERFHLARLMPWEMPKRRAPKKTSRYAHLAAAVVAIFVGAGILTIGALSIRAAAQSGARIGIDFAIPAILGTGVPLLIVPLGMLRAKRRFTALALAFTLGLGTNVLYLANAIPANAVTDNTSVFTFRNTSSFGALDMVQSYTPAAASSTKCPSAQSSNWTCSFSSDTFSTGQTMNAGNAVADLYLDNSGPLPAFRSGSASFAGGSGTQASLAISKPPSVADGDVLIAHIGVRGDVHTTLAAPSGWATVDRINQSTNITMGVFSHAVASAASEPATYTFTWTGNFGTVGSIMTFQNVDNTNPVDGHAGNPETGSTTTKTAPAVTASFANELQVLSFIQADNTYCNYFVSDVYITSGVGGVSSGASRTAIQSEYATKPLAAAGTTNAEANLNCSATPGVSHQLTLKQAAISGRTCTVTTTLRKVTPIKLRASASGTLVGGTNLVVNMPTTAQNDMILVYIGWNATASISTVPTGWTQTATNGASGQSLYVYRHVAGASEPATYTWVFSAAATVAAWSGAYVGIDSATPVDTDNGGGANSVTHSTGAITTSYAGDLIIAAYSLNAVATFTTPTAVSPEGVITAGSGPGVSLAVFDGFQASAGVVSSKTTTSSVSAQDANWLIAYKAATANTVTLGSGTATVTSVTGPTLTSTGAFATSATTFADGDRLQLDVTAPNDTNCGSQLSFDATATPSKLTVATIVPENVAGLLLLAPALPLAIRWWRRRQP